MGKPVYRKKNCPQCGVEHRKKGPFCSQGCHNRFRGPLSQETKDKISTIKKEWFATTIDGEALKSKLSLNMKNLYTGDVNLTDEDYCLDIPDIDSLDDDEKINW